jgi:hypothetical protein
MLTFFRRRPLLAVLVIAADIVAGVIVAWALFD